MKVKEKAESVALIMAFMLTPGCKGMQVRCFIRNVL
jgi:hypothetical protein